MRTPDLHNDQALLLRLQQDDRAAFGVLYKKYWPQLFDAAWKRVKSKPACQDIVQNVFADLWNRRHTAEIGNIGAYLHTAVRFQVYTQASRQPKQAHYLDTLDELVFSPGSADDLLYEHELLRLIESWLAILPERRRQIFLMHFREELSTREIAEELGLSQNTVQAQLYTATQSLRARMAHFLSLAAIVILSQR